MQLSIDSLIRVYLREARRRATSLLLLIIGAPFAVPLWPLFRLVQMKAWPGILAGYYIGLTVKVLAGIGWLLRLPNRWFYPAKPQPVVLGDDGEGSLSA